MKKIILFVLLLTILTNISQVYSYVNSDLTSKIEAIEKETNTYGGEKISLEERIKNAEKYVFGTAKNGDLNKRAEELSKVLGISFIKENSTKNTPQDDIESDIKANYPAVDKMEEKTFGKTFKSENIYKRLDRLEKKEFGTISDASLYDRVNKLEERFSEKNPRFAESKNSYTSNRPHYDAAKANDYAYYSPHTNNYELSLIEKKLFKKCYEGENISSRLSRVENKIFNQQFNNDSDEIRLERIYAVHKAAKSGTEYKVNKFAKYMATGIQVGGLILLILAMIL